MIRLVVDASVTAKWLFEEPGSTKAARLRDPSYQLMAPDLLLPEVGNVIWKRVRRNELPIEDGRRALRILREAPLHLQSTRHLLEAAWEIAVACGRTVYDSLYLALAVTLGAPLVTADRRLYEAVSESLLAPHVLWLEDLPD